MTPTDPGPGPLPGAIDDLLRRLRAWPESSWRHGDRLELARSTSQALADLAHGAGVRRVPQLASHALADQLTVLHREAADVAQGQADALLRGLGAALGFTSR